ncbi:hypothetical protein ACOMHN_052230 [Nucella lapillus]
MRGWGGVDKTITVIFSPFSMSPDKHLPCPYFPEMASELQKAERGPVMQAGVSYDSRQMADTPETQDSPFRQYRPRFHIAAALCPVLARRWWIDGGLEERSLVSPVYTLSAVGAIFSLVGSRRFPGPRYDRLRLVVMPRGRTEHFFLSFSGTGDFCLPCS